MKSSLNYMEKMKENGVKIPTVEESLMHMIYTGFFSSVFQIIEHDIDRETAEKCASAERIQYRWLGTIVEY